MTDKEANLLRRINDYADKNKIGIDPQKVLSADQIEKLKPILTTLAKEEGVSVADMLIKYMDLQGELLVKTQKLIDDSVKKMSKDGKMPFPFK